MVDMLPQLISSESTVDAGQDLGHNGHWPPQDFEWAHETSHVAYILFCLVFFVFLLEDMTIDNINCYKAANTKNCWIQTQRPGKPLMTPQRTP